MSKTSRRRGQIRDASSARLPTAACVQRRPARGDRPRPSGRTEAATLVRAASRAAAKPDRLAQVCSAAVLLSRQSHSDRGGVVVSDNMKLPEGMPVWRVELDPVRADELRREVGSDRRAAVEEQDWQGEEGAPVPPDA